MKESRINYFEKIASFSDYFSLAFLSFWASFLLLSMLTIALDDDTHIIGPTQWKA